MDGADDMDETNDDGNGAVQDILPSASEVEADGIAVDIVKEGDATSKEGNGAQQPEEEKLLPDYGAMGWRFCKWTVRKVSFIGMSKKNRSDLLSPILVLCFR